MANQIVANQIVPSQIGANQLKTRIAVVAGDPLRSVGLVTILEEIAGISASPAELAAIFDAVDFDMLLLDMNEPLENILQVIVRLRRERPSVMPLVMTETLSFEQIQAVIGAGAKGFLLDNAGIDEISRAIEIVLDGSIWAPRKVLAKLVEAGTASANVSGAHKGMNQPIEEMLTEREREVLHLLMSGRSNREIGAAMGIEQATVKAHLGRMLRKSRTNNRVELTLRAVKERGEEVE